MEIVLKIFAGLTVILGSFIFLMALAKKFSHLGMTLAGLTYLLGGCLSLYINSWWPALIGIILAVIIRKIFGEPDYSEQNSSGIDLKRENKTPYQTWAETYKPLMGIGEPLNYMITMDRITDMSQQEKDEYIKGKIDSNLFWTVINIKDGVTSVRPGRHEGNVTSWWICDVPYTDNVKEIVI
jgi:hypothetical protein